MAQEAQTKALALRGAFDDAGNVGHDERAIVTIRNQTQVGLHRRERIVGNLGLGSADARQERRFASIGESDKAHIGEQLQF